MLLLKAYRNFDQILKTVFIPLVILPATILGETREESRARADDIAVTARIEGLGVTVVESATGDLFILASDNESQAVGFARKLLRNSKIAEPWFLLLGDENGPLLFEAADRRRVECPLHRGDFALPDGRTFEIVAAYIPAQRNTAWLHSLGRRAGEFL
jgi:hypothetical protein